MALTQNRGGSSLPLGLPFVTTLVMQVANPLLVKELLNLIFKRKDV